MGSEEVDLSYLNPQRVKGFSFVKCHPTSNFPSVRGRGGSEGGSVRIIRASFYVSYLNGPVPSRVFASMLL